MSKAEKNYCVTDKELLAIRYFTEYYKHYLLGRHFTIRTDHQALRWLFSLRELKTGQQGGLRHYLPSALLLSTEQGKSMEMQMLCLGDVQTLKTVHAHYLMEKRY